MGNNISSTKNINNYIGNYSEMNNQINNSKNTDNKSIIGDFVQNQNKKKSSSNFDPVSYYSKLMAANTPRQVAALCKKLEAEIADAKKSGCDDNTIMKMRRILQSGKDKKVRLEDEEETRKRKNEAELLGKYDEAEKIKYDLERKKNSRMCTEATEFHQIAAQSDGCFSTQI